VHPTSNPDSPVYGQYWQFHNNNLARIYTDAENIEALTALLDAADILGEQSISETEILAAAVVEETVVNPGLPQTGHLVGTSANNTEAIVSMVVLFGGVILAGVALNNVEKINEITEKFKRMK